MRMYAIKDRLDGYITPIPFVNDEIAIRWFETMAETNTDMKYNLKDFSLWYMGEYDKDTGIFTSELKEVQNYNEN